MNKKYKNMERHRIYAKNFLHWKKEKLLAHRPVRNKSDWFKKIDKPLQAFCLRNLQKIKIVHKKEAGKNLVVSHQTKDY